MPSRPRPPTAPDSDRWTRRSADDPLRRGQRSLFFAGKWAGTRGALSLLVLHRLLPALFLSCATLPLALISGCADEEVATETDKVEARPAATLVDDAVTVDRGFADAVQVADDRLVIPSTGHERTLSRIKVGSVLAGDRAATKPGVKTTNPYGFLRRVTAIKTSGKQTVLSTKKAELSEWIKDGRLDFSSKRSLLDPKAKVPPAGLVTKTLQLQANEGSGAGAGEASTPLLASIDSAVSVSNATLTVKASFDGYFDVRHKDIWGPFDPPEGAAFKSVLTLDPSVAADITLSVSNSSTIDKVWTGAEVTIPIAAPIPVTLSFTPELRCVITAGGSLSVTVGANAGAHLVVGFEGDAGLTHFDITNLSQTPTVTGAVARKSVEGKATVAARCEIVAIPKLLVFDAVGIEGRIGPYEKLTADLCSITNPGGVTTGFTLREEHGLTYGFSGRVQVPILDQGKNFDLLSQADLPADGGEQFLEGNAETCTAKLFDSCAGRADGFFCSEIDPGAGIVCVGGSIAAGHQCGGGMKCTGGTPTEIRCQ